MTIECYHGDCPHHGTNLLQPEEGPFCFEEHCKASAAEIQRWELKRVQDVTQPLKTRYTAGPKDFP